MDLKIKLLCLANLNLMNATGFLYLKEIDKKNKQRKKKKYSALWLLRREEEGLSHKLIKEIADEDSKLYRSILRMTPHQFAKILEKVSPMITKQNTPFRNCIGPTERLQLTLRYLATGETQTSLQIPFRIQQSTISRILKETIPAIYIALNEEFLKFPQSEDDWRKISQEFYEAFQFPNCIGAIDGKHCKIRSLKKAGSTYFNYKGSNSFILMAIADAYCRFIYVDVGVNGRVGDAGTWFRSDLKYAIESSAAHIPAPKHLPFTTVESPYTFVADDAFALTNYMMKPYSHVNLNEKQRHFNYMVSKTRRVVENAFGILANRFQVLFVPIYRAPSEAIQVVLACICLHNFLRTENLKEKDIFYDCISTESIDEILQRNFDNLPGDRRRNIKSAQNIRKNLENYFDSFKLKPSI